MSWEGKDTCMCMSSQLVEGPDAIQIVCSAVPLPQGPRYKGAAHSVRGTVVSLSSYRLSLATARERTQEPNDAQAGCNPQINSDCGSTRCLPTPHPHPPLPSCNTHML